jgi:aminoglycoside phosphotransferase (APT) family kinase protein
MQETRGRLLAAGNVAEVYEWGPHALKLYRSPAAKRVAFREAANHAAVEALGLPVPAVWGVEQVDGRWGVLFDRVGAASFAERMRADPAVIPRHLACLAQLHARIHAQRAPSLGSLVARLSTNIAQAPLLAESRKQSLLRSLAAMPDGDRLCHGDFHPTNVLGDLAQPLVIDWPDAARGAPAADACRSYLLLRLHATDLAEPYLDAYGRAGGVPRAPILAWLPYLAAARLAEGVAGETERLLELARPT